MSSQIVYWAKAFGCWLVGHRASELNREPRVGKGPIYSYTCLRCGEVWREELP